MINFINSKKVSTATTGESFIPALTKCSSTLPAMSTLASIVQCPSADGLMSCSLMRSNVKMSQTR